MMNNKASEKACLTPDNSAKNICCKEVIIDNRTYEIHDNYIAKHIDIVKKENFIVEFFKNKWARFAMNVSIIFIFIPLLIMIGAVVLNGKNYDVIAIAIAVLCMIPFFMSFENSKIGARELVVIAVMVALSVSMRILFAPIPGFKPISAIVIIAGIAFGMESGFMVGALSAILSNMYFGQGPWTPFQMLSWGMIGVLAALLFKRKSMPNYFMLVIVAIIGGVMFSLMMDVYTVLSIGDGWSFERYGTMIIASVPFMIAYVVSNIVFLLVLARPIIKVTNRMREKYGIFE